MARYNHGGLSWWWSLFKGELASSGDVDIDVAGVRRFSSIHGGGVLPPPLSGMSLRDFAALRITELVELSLHLSVSENNKISMIPSAAAPQNPNPNPNLATNQSDFSTTLSSLKSLISLCHQTLQNPQFLLPNPRNDHFVPCPYNPHHLMPPESLFLHTLRCPSPLCIDPPNYQTTLHSSSYSHHQKTYFTVQDFNEELCFSIDDHFSNSVSSSFFYQDCPAVVSLSDVDASGSSKKTFTLPGFLSIECANVVCCNERDANRKLEGFDKLEFRILGSDLFFIRREIEAWNDYEYVTMYSFNVVYAISGLKMVKESDLNKWVVVNSPRFGVVIDVYVRDHIFVLVGLCLKAVIKEALGFVELANEQEVGRGLKSMTFKCPLLTQALMWLGSQLSVLYGQVNGKLFAINIFKHCILESASRLLFSSEQNLTESFDLKRGDKSLHANHNDTLDVKVEEPFESRAECREDKSVGETVHSKVIFVSQVAAAIAALHERSWLGEKIRGLRVSQPLTSYQRMAEHAYVSNRADEERNKRPNYRPIIEHDGLPWQRSSNQETNKNKTREELLAEERDYKRRRMSYRGKKVKRTTLQVMRDIIEGYMDEIKQAGGIGCFEKGDEEGGMFSSELSSHDLDADDHRKINSDSFEATRAIDGPNYNRKQSWYDYDFKSTSVEDALPRDRKQSRQSLHGNREHLEVHRSRIDGEKHGGEYYSSSSERRKSHDQSHERSNHQRGREDVELTRTKHDETKRPSSSRSNYRDYRSSYSVSNSSQKTRRNRSTDSHVPNAFEDRYDPSESHDWYEDDVVNGDNYVRPE
ncbi:hypothetical protein Dsin_021341 [Dipteronia sinensis]|uniref:CHHC U11-48K-type domain-containing protein n=1 Tax=Dipteronia sinensis TaxID=43782 RepID=A0AAE0A0S6_9ROSI|nr:hypothetical protein Dsin_021341 [Dipteronia sinensis]